MKSTFPLSVAAGWARVVAVFVVDVALRGCGRGGTRAGRMVGRGRPWACGDRWRRCCAGAGPRC